MDDIAGRLTETGLVAEFGVETLGRGRAYAQDGAVLDVQLLDHDPDSLRAFAQVRGSAGKRYSVLLTVTSEPSYDGVDLDVWSRCSCPVTDSCKHGAAVALVLGGRARTDAAGRWSRQLSSLLDDLTPDSPARPPKAVAIRAELKPGRRHSWGQVGPAIHLRLLNEGARNNWIKTGITWNTVPTARSLGTHKPDQLDALSGLHAGLLSNRHYYSALEEPSLAEFGPLLWTGLADALAAGIHLELSANLVGLEVLDKPLALAADVVSAPDGARLMLGVEHDDRLWAGDSLLTVGNPIHGVVLLEGEVPLVHAVLAPLDRPVPVSTGALLTSPEPVTLPEESRAEWSEVLLPRLSRVLRLGSSNDSVILRPPPRPTLHLTVEWHSATSAELRWAWRYDGRAVELESRDRLDGLRDAESEREILGQLPVPPQHSVETVTGADALELAVHTLPAVRAVDDVDVVEVERPDFREATGEIAIGFDAVAGESDEEPGPVDWLDLLVTIRVEGEQVPLPSVLEALTLGHDHVVLPSGLYVGTDRPEFAALDDLVRAAAEVSEQPRDGVSVGAHDLGLWAQLADLGVVDSQAATWVAKARALRDLTELPAPGPRGITSTLRGYQLEGFHWLAFLWQHGLGGILADDMGLGKTLQVLALVAHARAEGSEPFLVVAPSSVVSAWQSEAARHAPGLRVAAITSSVSRRGVSVADLAVGADLVVTTYTLLRLEQDQYADVAWGGLVLDEAQQVKNHQSKTYRAVRTLAAPFKLAVTGTPFENRLMELWALLSITVPGLYPWPQKFGQQVVGPVEKRRDEGALRRFRQRIHPFMLRRTKERVAADLPPKQEQVLELELSGRHRRIYDTHLQRERQKILGLLDDFDQNRVAIFSALTRLRLLALDPALVDPTLTGTGSAKLDVLVEHLEEISAEGHRALVFSQFTSYLTMVRERLDAEGVPTCYLDGSTRRRGEVVEEWRRSDAAAFLISLKAGGIGLTLTEADYVFVLDPWWNPATEAQAVDRAHRIGQHRPVIVYRLVSSDTIEEKVMELKARKAELFAQVIEGDGLLSSAIGVDDIRSLFSSD